MTQTIGRKAIKKTIKVLKQNYEFQSKYFQSAMKTIEQIEKYFMKKENFSIQMIINSTSLTLLESQNASFMYINTLENYLAELDETFDKIFEEAKELGEKEAEEQLKKVPKNLIV